MSLSTRNPQHRPLGVAHLIFGLVFTGIAAIWMIGRASGSDIPDFTIGLPAVLIGAGIIGLAATVLNQRRARARRAAKAARTAESYDAMTQDAAEPVDAVADVPADVPADDAAALGENEDTTVLTTEGDPS